MSDISVSKIFRATLAALLFSLSLISAGSCAIAVEEGDWAKYRIEVEIPEEIAELMEDEEFDVFDVMEWVKVEVQSVSDTSVTLKTTLHYKNGTEETESMDGTGFIIDTDFGEGDEVPFPMFGPETPLGITGSKQKTYAGASREVSYVDFEQEAIGISTNFEACWDKETGIFVKRRCR